MRTKIGILLEGDFYENEIYYYQLRFPEDEYEVQFLTRLWGQPSLTFQGHELKAPMSCDTSFEDLTDKDLEAYAAIIVPAGMVSDRLRYTDDVETLPPACDFMKKIWHDDQIIKGIICHGMWLMSPIAELVKGRKAVVHNNLLGDAKNYGIEYHNEDVVVDGDLITARTGGHCNVFAKAILEKLNS